MANSKSFSYQKRQAGRDLNPARVVNTVRADDTQAISISLQENIISSYTKSEGMLSYNIICVISGGTERERDFLVELDKKHTFKSLDIIFISTPKGEGGLTPRMMKDKLSEICKNGILNLRDRSIELDNVDSIYMLTDVDHYEEELKEILRTSDIEYVPIWIISNPCFEIWLYYCYRNNPNEELSDIISVSPNLRSVLLKTINGRFNNGGGLDPRKAFEHLVDGISNSREHYVEQENFPIVLSTQMHIFAEKVLLLLDKEYHSWLQQKEEIRKRQKLMRMNR